MSFQKAHQISNELAEVVVQTAVTTSDLSGAATNVPFLFQPMNKSYRILEIGVVTTNATASTGATALFGTTSGGSEIVINTDNAFAIDAEQGRVYSTSNVIALNSDGAALDADGVPRLEKGQSLFFRNLGTASAGTTVIAFARLAPIIEYKD